MAPAIVNSQPINASKLEKTTPHTGEIKVQDLRTPTKKLETWADGELGSKRDIIIFSDFDGTIFMQDTGHILFDAHGCGEKRRKELDEEIKNDTRSFREVSEEMWGSLNVPFEDGFDVMKGALDIDPDFLEFHAFCVKNNIPFNVISAGLKPILRRVLDEFLGKEKSGLIDIIANGATISADGSVWKPEWRHNTSLGHDKAASIQEYRTIASSESEDGSCPLIIFIGDGVSDLAASREADVLFARRGLKLEEYCRDNRIAYIAFDTFADIQKEIIKIMREDQNITHGYGKPVKYNPRGNFWRKAIKPKNLPRFVKNASKEDRLHLWPNAFSVKQEAKKEIEDSSSTEPATA
jgi:2,3-diketo-5-methylthio-1-phosphopentane phosphatase